MKSILIIGALTVAILNLLLTVPASLQEVVRGLDPVSSVALAAAAAVSSIMIVTGIVQILEAGQGKTGS